MAGGSNGLSLTARSGATMQTLPPHVHSQSRPPLIGHRGRHSLYPENRMRLRFEARLCGTREMM
jgi:hypothetical protein